MAHDTESGREKMAEGDNNAEKLKEKANNYFKGTFLFRLCRVYILMQAVNWDATCY